MSQPPPVGATRLIQSMWSDKGAGEQIICGLGGAVAGGAGVVVKGIDEQLIQF
jgi:hypothetical protein